MDELKVVKCVDVWWKPCLCDWKWSHYTKSKDSIFALLLTHSIASIPKKKLNFTLIYTYNNLQISQKKYIMMETFDRRFFTFNIFKRFPFHMDYSFLRSTFFSSSTSRFSFFKKRSGGFRVKECCKRSFLNQWSRWTEIVQHFVSIVDLQIFQKPSKTSFPRGQITSQLVWDKFSHFYVLPQREKVLVENMFVWIKCEGRIL